jgi:hypothetical protein
MGEMMLAAAVALSKSPSTKGNKPIANALSMPTKKAS